MAKELVWIDLEMTGLILRIHTSEGIIGEYEGLTGPALAEVKIIADYICENNGGSGAFREFADIILKEKFPDKTKWY